MQSRNAGYKDSIACSALSDVINNRFNIVFLPVVTKDIRQFRLVRRDSARDKRSVDVMTVIHIIRDSVATPGSAAHRQREWKTVIKGATRGKAMSLINNNPAHRQVQSEVDGAFVIG